MVATADSTDCSQAASIDIPQLAQGTKYQAQYESACCVTGTQRPFCTTDKKDLVEP
jgi:hypothetical protein